jgi:hypothetical protein
MSAKKHHWCLWCGDDTEHGDYGFCSPSCFLDYCLDMGSGYEWLSPIRGPSFNGDDSGGCMTDPMHRFTVARK